MVRGAAGAWAEKLYEAPHPEIAGTLREMGSAYSGLGNAAKALDYGHKALAIQEKLYAGPHRETAHSLSNLGASSPTGNFLAVRI